MDVESRDLPEFLLGERDKTILYGIGRERLTGFSFDGLKRMLGVHPETLSRSLDRLEDEGLIEKAEDGYRVTGRAEKLFGVRPLGMTGPPVPLVQTLLPYDVSIGHIVLNLKGKWFGDLRWVGYSENGEGTVLKWITEDGAIQVDAKLSGGELSIEAKLREENDVNEAVKASHVLLSHIARLYTRKPRARHVAFFTALNPYETFAYS